MKSPPRTTSAYVPQEQVVVGRLQLLQLVRRGSTPSGRVLPSASTMPTDSALGLLAPTSRSVLSPSFISQT